MSQSRSSNFDEMIYVRFGLTTHFSIWKFSRLSVKAALAFSFYKIHVLWVHVFDVNASEIK